MDKEFYDKYSKDFECSCCQDLEHCINGKEPLKINCAIHFFKDKIADLEAKLAESEDRIAKARRQAYSSRQMDNTLKIRRLADEITAKEKAITKLKQQCKECKHINKKIELNIKNKLMNEIQQLKQQLAEKEKERHEEWLTGKEWKWECDRLKREQNQTAIAELNNILDTFAIFVNEEKESLVSLDGSGNLSLLEYIENRIDTLKGESK